MDSQLQEDLAEALGDCDPLELVLQDPLLAQVVEELIQSCHENSINARNTENSHKTSQSTLFSIGSDINDLNEAVGKPCVSTLEPFRTGHKCVCCGRPARGIHYYGAKICDSCKSFFARSIKKDLYKSFICEYNCKKSSDSRSWLKCQRCRFDQLCRVGLKIPNKYTEETEYRAKQTQDIFKQRDEIYQHCLNQIQSKLLPSIALSSDEVSKLEQLTVMQTRMVYNFVSRIFKQNVQALQDHLDFVYNGTSVPLKTLKLDLDYLLFSFQETFPQMQKNSWLIETNLSSKDINRLVVANYPLCHELTEAFRMNELYSSCINSEVDILLRNVKKGLDYDSQHKVSKVYSKVSKCGTLQPIEKTYEMMYDQDELGISSDKEASRRHRWLINKIQGNSDFVVLVLNLMVIMYTPDFIQLDDAQEAQRVQLAYANLLYRYLKDKRTSKADAMFRESMLASSYARELKDIRYSAFAKKKL